MKTNYELRICRTLRSQSIFFTFCFLFLFFSCGQDQKKEIIPADVLPEEKMSMVIADIHIAEAGINLKTFPDSASKENLSFEKIFEKNKITKAQYDTSIAFYIDHPELLNEVYEKVLNELSKMQGNASKQ